MHSGLKARPAILKPRFLNCDTSAAPGAGRKTEQNTRRPYLRITLTGGSHHLIHTHPLDFIVTTPMAIQDGLRRGGSVLLEPILAVTFIVPTECAGRRGVDPLDTARYILAARSALEGSIFDE